MKNIAVIAHGGVRGGLFDQGVPALTNLVNGLSKHHNVKVYSFSNQKSDLDKQGLVIKKVNKYTIVPILILDHFKCRFDIIHGFWGSPGGILATFLGKLLTRPSIVSLQGGEAACLPSIGYGGMLYSKSKNRILKACNRATILTGLTRFQFSELEKHGFDRKDRYTIPFGVNKNHFTFSKKELNPPYKFLHVANITEVKDQQTLLKAFKAILSKVDAELTIIGPDYLGGKIQSLCERMDIDERVKFVGPIPHRVLSDYFSVHHFLLHTSLYEAQGVVVNEAFSSGVLVVGTNVGILSDLNNKCCLTCSTGDFEEISRLVLKLISNDSLSNELKINAKRWSDSYDSQWTLEEYLKLYDLAT